MGRQRVGVIFLLAALLASLLVAKSTAATAAPGVVGDGTAGSCTEAAFVLAFSTATVVTFDCGVDLVAIPVSNTHQISDDVTIDGGGLVTLNGGGDVMFFHVAQDARLRLIGLTLADAVMTSVGGSVTVESGGELTATSVTLRGSVDNQFGGGIVVNRGTAYLTDVLILDVFGPISSGIVNNLGTVTMVDGALLRNQGDVGGAIYNDGEMTLQGTLLSQNSGAMGGAIYNDAGGTLVARGIDVSTNTARDGGGIYNIGALTVEGSTIDTNYSLWGGGGITNGGTAHIIETVISNNTSSGEGGGVSNFIDDGFDSLHGQLTIDGSQLRMNEAGEGGGVFNFAGDVSIRDTTLDANQADLRGGGVAHYSAGGELVIERSAVTANYAQKGGGLYVGNGAVVRSSTIAGNLGMTGAGIFVNEELSVEDSTIAANTGYGGAGIENEGALTIGGSTLAGNGQAGNTASLNNYGTATLVNTMVANPAGGWACLGTPVVSLGHNLDTDDTCGLSDPSDQVSVDPKIGPLADNGGLGQTHALMPDSPAIDAGDDAACLVTDQRGATRPLDGDGDGTATCDIGAFEAGSLTQDVTAPTRPQPSADRVPDLNLPGTADDWYRDWVWVTPGGASDPSNPDGSPGSGVVGYTTNDSLVYGTTQQSRYAMRAVDASGNVSPAAVRRISVDASYPVVECAAIQRTWQRTNPRALCTATDTGSGLVDTVQSQFFLETSVLPGMETSAGRILGVEVCDRVGHCVTVGGYTGLQIDRRAPTLTVLTTLTRNATGAAGAYVSIPVSATDAGSGVSSASCDVPSSSVFPIGTTTVTCRAVDNVGNTRVRSTLVTIRGISEQITALRDTVAALDAPAATRERLDAALGVASDDGSGQCGALDDFIDLARAERAAGDLTDAQVTRLRIDTRRIQRLMGCTTSP